MSTTMIHLRKIRSKKRRISDPNIGADIMLDQVFTLCGQWVSPKLAIRQDRRFVSLNLCDECCAQRALTGVYGERETSGSA